MKEASSHMSDSSDFDYEAWRLKNAAETQQKAYLALGRLLTRTRAARLAPIPWEVLPTGVLRGTIPSYSSINGASLGKKEKGALYEEWCAFFGPGLRHEKDLVLTSVPATYKTARVTDLPWQRGTNVVLTVELTDR